MGFTPVISTNDGSKSNENSNCPNVISFSNPNDMEPWLYAEPLPSSIEAVARIISLYSTSMVMNSPGSEMLSIRNIDGCP